MPLNIGVDFGSLGWRAAWQDGAQVVVIHGDAGKGGWLLCEPSRTSGIGVSFPSVKSKLGQGPAYSQLSGGDARDPQYVVTDHFRDIFSAVESHGAGPVGQAVVTVPARYSASRRTALRQAALDAGFADVHLLNDSMAAVVSRAHPRVKSATLLVCAFGYAGYEMGLVRVARGHYRALGYEGGDSPSGAALDELVIHSWLTGVERMLNLRPDNSGWDLLHWLRLQRSAQWTKEALTASGQAQFPMALQPAGRSESHAISMSSPTHLEEVKPWFELALDRAQKLLADCGLSAPDLDEVLLVGGSARIPWVAALVQQRLGHAPLLVPPDAPAQGAALHAARLDSGPGPASLLTEREDAVGREPADPPAAAMSATLDVSAAAADSQPTEPAASQSSAAAPERYVVPAIPAAPAATPAAEGRADDPAWSMLAPVRILLDQGRFTLARGLLQAVIQGAQELLARLPAVDPPTNQGAGRTSTAAMNAVDAAARLDAERAITHARRLLREGKRQEAVDQSHVAWAADPNSPEIFDQMIDVHVEAALEADDRESFADALNWLMCAHKHDQSNSKVQAALAERNFVHARQLAEARRFAEARAALEQCLYWNPEYELGQRLRETLSRR